MDLAVEREERGDGVPEVGGVGGEEDAVGCGGCGGEEGALWVS